MNHEKGKIFYVEASQTYIEITSTGGNYKSVIGVDDVRIWENFFSKAKVFLDANSNLHKQIYEYLKTQSGFENTIDA